MGKHEDKTPPAANWIRKLEASINTHTDPVTKLARHVVGDGDAVLYMIGHDDDPGAVHFAAPAEWFTGHHWNRHRQGILHTEGKGEPFSRAVDKGHALVVWLKPEALPAYVPYEHARDLLRIRADQLAAALAEKEHIAPLEARVYFPPQDFLQITNGTDHAVGAALLLASTRENDAALRKAFKRLQSARTVAEATASREADAPKPAPSPQAIERMLSPHRIHGNARLEDDWLAVGEIASQLNAAPQVLARDGNGTITVSATDAATRKHQARLKGEELGLAPGHSHVLLLPVHKTLRVTPDSVSDKSMKTNPAHAAAIEYDTHTLKPFLKTLHRECGGEWGAGFIMGTPLGDLLALNVESHDQEATLIDARNFIEDVKRDRHHDDRRWEQYLDDRHIAHTPPTPRR